MNGSRFVKFKHARKHRMLVNRTIGTSDLTTSNGHKTAAKMQGIGHLPDHLPWQMVARERLKKVWGVLPGGPAVMTQESAAKAQGIFLPNWWLAILLIPAAYGVYSAGQSLTRIETKIDAAETRIKAVETQGRLNDEHTRQLELEIARTKGVVETMAKLKGEKDKEDQ